MTNAEYCLEEGKQTALGHPLYRHRETGALYGGLSRSAGPIYYPVNSDGEPIDSPTGVHPPSEAKIFSPLDLDVVGDRSVSSTRQYALENEDSDDLLNHPNGIEWV